MLIHEINATIRAHYPEGDVSFVEVIRACMATATAYQRALEGHSPAHANLVAESAKAISEWMTANKH